MNVKELITKLLEFDLEAEVILAADNMYVAQASGIQGCLLGGQDVDEVYGATRAIGIATSAPTKIPVVVIDYSTRDM